MLKKHLAAYFVGTFLATMPAVAQTGPATTVLPPINAPSGPAAGLSITRLLPGQWRASKLVGVNVYDADNNKVGDLREVLLNHDGEAEAVVIRVRGLLGLGEKDVAVPFKALEWVTDPETAAPPPVVPPTGPMPSETAVPRPAGQGSGPGAPSATGPSEPGPLPGGVAQMDRAVVAISRGFPDRAVLGMTKADLQNAPAFSYSSDTRAPPIAPGRSTNPPRP
jgi:sporulation protein YlmC with PRC-barrel domain